MIAPTYYTLCALNFFTLKNPEAQYEWEQLVLMDKVLYRKESEGFRFWEAYYLDSI